MEYLWYSARSLGENQAIDIFNARRISHKKTDLCISIGPHGLVTNGLMARGDDKLYGLFGSAFVNYRFLNNFALRSEAETIRACKEIAESPECATGTFTGVIADLKTGDTNFLLDSLNSTPCFVVRHTFGFAVSNNVHMLADWLSAQGITPTRTVEPALSHMVFSSGLTAGNLYREIHLVQPQERPVVKNAKLDLVYNDPIWPGLLSASYEDIISEAANRISKRIQVLTEIDDEAVRVFDVTGGMDSRIILAAIVGAGVVNEWRFHNYFHPRHPDSNFAHFVADKWDIRQWPKETGTVLPPTSKAFLDLYLSFGTELKGAAHADLYRPSYLHVAGSFGELGGKSQDAKRFQIKRQSKDGADMMALGATVSDPALQSSYVDSYLDRTGLLGEQFGLSSTTLDWARRTTSRQIDLARGENLDFEQMPVIFYQRGKARSHFGMDAFLRGMREQFAEVLNDPYLTAAAVKIGATKSNIGKINFDLIRKLGGDEIASLPLVNERWSRALFDSDEEAQRFWAPPITSESEMLFEQGPQPQVVQDAMIESFRSDLWNPNDLDAVILNAQKNAASPAHRRTANLIGLADYLLRQGPVSTEVAQYLPDASIWDIIKDDPQNFKQTGTLIHVLQFFCQAEMWIRGMEEAPFQL